ncbi:MAG TPA: glycerophosphodiester phosphodiesterase [Usitatibacteraceae bacterium]|nr:glycerophosphodiester phosphodiesterase [Usitatibacteraceae bacterium]
MRKTWPYPQLVAHRGGGLLAPENTLAAIRLGQSLGFRAAEFDVKLTRDDVAFLLHDSTLDRTTSGSGAAGDRNWEELAALDAGGWHSETFSGEPIARFDEAARLLRSAGTIAIVEIKPVPGTERATGLAVAAQAQAHWRDAEVPPLLSSFSRESLAAARESAPLLPRGLIVEAPTDADFASLDSLGAVSLHCGRKYATPELFDRAHAAGYRVLVWTVNDPPEAKRLLAWGADGIITDNLRQFATRFPDRL